MRQPWHSHVMPAEVALRACQCATLCILKCHFAQYAVLTCSIRRIDVPSARASRAEPQMMLLRRRKCSPCRVASAGLAGWQQLMKGLQFLDICFDVGNFFILFEGKC